MRALTQDGSSDTAPQPLESTPGARRPLGWPVVLCWAVLLGSLAQLPHVVARRAAGETTYLGTLAPWPEDMTYHLSFAEQARRGAWLFEDKYNGNRVETRLIFNSLFLALGGAARVLGTGLVETALVAKLLLGIGLLLSAYRFAMPFLTSRAQEVLFLILAPFGSGLGWLTAWGLVRSFEPIDLFFVELPAFHGMVDDLIVPATTMVLLWTLPLLDRALARPSRRRALAGGLAALLLGTVHPHDLLVTVYGVGALVTLARVALPRLRTGPDGAKAYVGALGWVVLCSLPVLLYDAYVLWREPLFWSYVTLNDGFHVTATLGGLGFPLVLAAIGAFRAVRAEAGKSLLLVTWLVLDLVLLFVPVPPCGQFFLLHGVQVGVCLLAAEPLALIWERFVRRSRPPGGPRWILRAAAAAVVVSLVLGSCLTMVVHVQRWADVIAERDPDRYMPSDLAACLAWLGDHADASNTLLAGARASRLAPALAGVRVFAAQEEQTVDYFRWRDDVKAFFEGRARPGPEAFLDEHGIRFVLVGPEERDLGGPALDVRLGDIGSLRKVLAVGRFQLLERAIPLRLRGSEGL